MSSERWQEISDKRVVSCDYWVGERETGRLGDKGTGRSDLWYLICEWGVLSGRVGELESWSPENIRNRDWEPWTLNLSTSQPFKLFKYQNSPIFAQKKLSTLLFYFLKAISYLPFWFWHGVSDLLSVLIYYVLGYRKKVVMENLDLAFPDKSKKEKEKIARKFYRNFTDFIVESIKAFSMSAAAFEKRYQIVNFDEILDYVSKHQQGAVLTATHSFSWEWMISAGHRLPQGINAYIAYTPLSNKPLDKLIRKNRERFGLKLSRASKFAENLKNQPSDMLSLCGLIADQSPKKQYKFRTN